MTSVPIIMDEFEIYLEIDEMDQWADLLVHLGGNNTSCVDERIWTNQENKETETTYPSIEFIVQQAKIFSKATKNSSKITLDDILNVFALYGYHVIRGLDRETKKIENEMSRLERE